MKRVYYFFAGMMLILAFSCVAPEEWSDKFDESIVPNPVSNVAVENVNGGAIITYSLPSNINKKELLGVKATYSLTPDGELMERWSSAEKDTIELEGYGDTNERSVTLYTVHKNNNLSDGVPVTVKPLTPPIFLMRETLDAASTFGGIQITWDNPLRKDMGIALYTEDSITHEMMLFDKYFSNSLTGKIAFRPFKPEEQNFRIEMFDRWQNFSQNLETTLTPLEEVVIQSRDERGNPLWAYFDHNGTLNGMERFRNRCEFTHFSSYVFDNCIDWPDNGSFWYPYFEEDFASYFPDKTVEGKMPYPWYITFDMGKKAVYSRFLHRPFQRSPVYSATLMVEFNIWGSNNPKTVEEVEDPHGLHPKGSREANQAYWCSWAIANGTDAWKNDGWVKLATCKYSLSDGTNKFFDGMALSAEDVSHYQNGYEFEFNEQVTDAFRYLRWEILSVNNDIRQLYMGAIQYHGSYPKGE